MSELTTVVLAAVVPIPVGPATTQD